MEIIEVIFGKYKYYKKRSIGNECTNCIFNSKEHNCLNDSGVEVISCFSGDDKNDFIFIEKISIVKESLSKL